MTNYECAGGPDPNYGETAVFAFCRKAEKRPKIRFSLYKHPPNGSSLLIIWEKATFFFWQLFPVVAGTWSEARSDLFFLAKNFRFSARKSVFWYGTAIFVNGPFVALAVPVVLAPSEAFFDFSFPSYGRFREGTRPTRQKVLPHPTMQHCLTVTALALSARRPFGPARFARGLDNICYHSDICSFIINILLEIHCLMEQICWMD